mgnify:CR=1 FL=1
MTEKSGCAATPMQLFDTTVGIEQPGLQFQLPVYMLQIGCGLAVIAGDDLVAGAVEADCIAEGDMQVQRQRTRYRVLVAVGCPLAIIAFGDAVVELRCSRVGCVARPGLVIATDQVGIEGNVLRHESVYRLMCSGPVRIGR